MNNQLAEQLPGTADAHAVQSAQRPHYPHSGPVDRHVRITELIAAPVFLISLLFLVLIAVLLVLDVAIDGPVTEASVSVVDGITVPDGPVESGLLTDPTAASWLAGVVFTALLIIWPIFWIEHLYSKIVARSRGYKGKLFDSLVCLVPPLRLVAPCPVKQRQVWIPFAGWRAPGRELHRKLERTLSKPMLFIGLLILPVLLIEGSLAASIAERPGLALALRSATALIWLAFTAEFILMLNTTDKKLAYVKAHWLELAIIILPLVSFLRFLRVIPAARLVSLQRFAKMAKTFRMRGLVGRTVRALALLEVLSRLLRENPQTKLARLKETHEEKYLELAELQEQISLLESDIEQTRNAQMAEIAINADECELCLSCQQRRESAVDGDVSGWRSAA